MGYDQINQSLDMISHNSARALNIQETYGLEVGKPGSLLLLPAENGFDAVRRQVPVGYSIRKGNVIARTKPAETSINLGAEEAITFKR
ncbi:cytosine deaminase [Vibrio maritimus]|uniref:Cytosine deaminase n=1 Tax=Vibrio maritimus TaxID=990268 RepID=A0A090SBD3_9VIBR|nr:cytosine deaminase [Vibrio maritimus]